MWKNESCSKSVAVDVITIAGAAVAADATLNYFSLVLLLSLCRCMASIVLVYAQSTKKSIIHINQFCLKDRIFRKILLIFSFFCRFCHICFLSVFFAKHGEDIFIWKESHNACVIKPRRPTLNKHIKTILITVNVYFPPRHNKQTNFQRNNMRPNIILICLSPPQGSWFFRYLNHASIVLLCTICTIEDPPSLENLQFSAYLPQPPPPSLLSSPLRPVFLYTCYESVGGQGAETSYKDSVRGRLMGCEARTDFLNQLWKS